MLSQTMSPERRSTRARHGSSPVWDVPADDPRRIEVLQDLTADRLADQIRAALGATSLRPEQIRELRALLTGGAR